MSSIKNRKISNDKIYTPPKIVDIMIDFCGYKEGDNVLYNTDGINGDEDWEGMGWWYMKKTLLDKFKVELNNATIEE
mgnify:CR=1 FL=1